MPNYPNTQKIRTARETVRETVLPIVTFILIVLAVAATLTGITLHSFAQDCARSGGTYSVDGGTAWCRH